MGWFKKKIEPVAKIKITVESDSLEHCYIFTSIFKAVCDELEVKPSYFINGEVASPEYEKEVDEFSRYYNEKRLTHPLEVILCAKSE